MLPMHYVQYSVPEAWLQEGCGLLHLSAAHSSLLHLHQISLNSISCGKWPAPVLSKEVENSFCASVGLLSWATSVHLDFSRFK